MKSGGLGDNLYVGGYDLSGDIGSIQKISGGPKPLVVTGINKSAFERIGGGRDGGIDFNAFFNDAAGQAHPRLSTLPTADVVVMYCRGTTLGNAAAACVAKQINYDGTRAADGAYTFAVQALANGYGVEWGTQLTAGKRTDTSATNGASVDFSASTSLGWQAYLEVFAVTGTSVTVTLEDSADDSTFAAFTGSAFAAATGPGTERIAGSSSATVRRYVRAVTSGTFTEAVFAVMFVKNKDVAVSF